MSAAELKALSWEQFHPLRLPLGEDTLILEHCLRLLPGKRIAARARINDEPVFAKVFFAGGHAAEAQLEKQVIEQVAASGVCQAPLRGLYKGDGFTVIVQQWLPALTPLAVSSVDDVKDSVQQVLAVLGQLREAGLCQRDPHLANFARSTDGRLYFMDAGDVVPCGGDGGRRFMDSLALFCAQVPARSLAETVAAAAAFFSPSIESSALMRRVHRVNRRRIRHAMKKWLRPCSAIMPLASDLGSGWMDRAHADAHADILALLANPEQLPLIKRGSRIAVYGDERWVVKCYRDSSWRARAKRRLNRSPARRSWRMGWTLDMLGLPTPRPVALLEKSGGEALLLFPTVSGERFSEVLEQDRSRAQVLAADIRSSIAAMGLLGLWHGDLKAQNILLPLSGHSLIDLDAAGWSASTAYARHRHARDVARFELNWSQFTVPANEDSTQ